MKVATLVEQIIRLKGVIPEPVRTTIAVRFAKAIGKDLVDDEEWDLASEWSEGGSTKFMQACGVETPPCAAPLDITVDQTALSKFIQKWAFTRAYRTKDDIKPMTPEMLQLVRAMLRELREIADGPPSTD